MTTPQHLSVIIVGIPFRLAALASLWKSASLRGDTHLKWRDRVDLAHAGLTELALARIADLRDSAGELVGSDGRFRPDLARVDPAPLTRLTREFERYIRVREKLNDRFRMLLRVCGLTPMLVGLFIAGDVAALSSSGSWNEPDWIEPVGIAISVTILVIGLGIVGIYVHVNRFLTDAEIVARGVATPSQDGQ